MNCKECAKRRCPSFGTSEKCNVCLYTGGDYLETRDWLSDIDIPTVAAEAFDCVEVRFKNGRKGFYRNVNRLPLAMGDIVAVESSPGHDIGCVMLVGEMARLQMRRKKEDPANPEIRKVYRVATQKDIEIWQTAISREKKTLVRTREICDNLGLVMKLSDVEFQGDNLKATFYYTAEGRVDFRQLIKELAGAFGVRIEMRQIGLRQEAARVGSIGSCGRELCCTTWLTDFRSVNTSAARVQRLSLNPQKLAGQCGKLKCCLNFELDVYADALKGFPASDVPLRTEKGIAYFQKMDVFKGMYWYAYDFEAMNWIGLRVASVSEIQRLNRRGEKPESLELYVEQDEPAEKSGEEMTALKAVEEGEITRFDRNTGRSSRRRGDRRRDKNATRAAKGAGDAVQSETPSAESASPQAGERNTPNGSEPAREKNRRDRNARREDKRRDNRADRAEKKEDAAPLAPDSSSIAVRTAPENAESRPENRRERNPRRRNRGNRSEKENTRSSGNDESSRPLRENPQGERAEKAARQPSGSPEQQAAAGVKREENQASQNEAGEENRNRRGRRDGRRRGNRRHDDSRPSGNERTGSSEQS